MAKIKEQSDEDFVRRQKNEFINVIDSIDEVETELRKLQRKLEILHRNLYSMLIESERFD